MQVWLESLVERYLADKQLKCGLRGMTKSFGTTEYKLVIYEKSQFYALNWPTIRVDTIAFNRDNHLTIELDERTIIVVISTVHTDMSLSDHCKGNIAKEL